MVPKKLKKKLNSFESCGAKNSLDILMAIIFLLYIICSYIYSLQSKASKVRWYKEQSKVMQSLHNHHLLLHLFLQRNGESQNHSWIWQMGHTICLKMLNILMITVFHILLSSSSLGSPRLSLGISAAWTSISLVMCFCLELFQESLFQ